MENHILTYPVISRKKDAKIIDLTNNISIDYFDYDMKTCYNNFDKVKHLKACLQFHRS